jgi:hypothetical protein
MGDDPNPAVPAHTLKRLRQIVTLGALVLALAHLIWPDLAIDSVTLVLIAIALVPWLAPIFKSLQFPGGWKVEFQELQRAAQRADAAGLLAPQTDTPGAAEFSFQRAAEQDPNLALAGLRIEIEKRLIILAETEGLEVRGRGLGQLLRILSQHQVLDEQARSALADLTGLLNAAVHGAAVDPNTAAWAIDIGPRILRGLDELIAQS